MDILYNMHKTACDYIKKWWKFLEKTISVSKTLHYKSGRDIDVADHSFHNPKLSDKSQKRVSKNVFFIRIL